MGEALRDAYLHPTRTKHTEAHTWVSAFGDEVFVCVPIDGLPGYLECADDPEDQFSTTVAQAKAAGRRCVWLEVSANFSREWRQE